MRNPDAVEVHTEAQRESLLVMMKSLSDAFYSSTTKLGVHPFIEFTGLLNEYISMCREAHKDGIDFTQCNTHTGQTLPMAPHNLAYLNEKIECIFSGAVKLVPVDVDQANPVAKTDPAPPVPLRLRVGAVLKDNDPGGGGKRRLTVESIDGQYAFCVGGYEGLKPRRVRLLTRRIHADDKPRRSGFTVIG